MDPSQGISTSDVFEVSDEDKLALMAKNCLRLLDAGVTTARDLGSPGTFAVTIRDAIVSKKMLGPRLLVANGKPASDRLTLVGPLYTFTAIRTDYRQPYYSPSNYDLAAPIAASTSSYHRTTRSCT